PICVDGTASVLEPTIEASVATAVAALQNFDSASPKKMRKMRKKAGTALGRISKVTAKALKKHKASAACAATIESIVGDLRARERGGVVAPSHGRHRGRHGRRPPRVPEETAVDRRPNSEQFAGCRPRYLCASMVSGSRMPGPLPRWPRASCSPRWHRPSRRWR